MFDGSFRSKKEVNLSGGGGRRRKGATKNKDSILKNAEAQRKQRQEHQRRSKNARFLQRCTRGWLTRLHLLEEWLPAASTSLKVTSRCLVFRKWLPKYSTTAKQLLLDFARATPSLATVANEADDPMDISIHNGESIYEDCLWISRKRVVYNLLRELVPKNIIDVDEQQELFSMLVAFWPSCRRKIDDSLFLALTTCLSYWIKEGLSDHDITKVLGEWAIEESQKLTNTHTRALLASILLGSASNTEFVSSLPGDLYEMWVVPLVAALETESSATGNTDSIQRATQKNLQNGQEHRILSNLLQDPKVLNVQEPQALIQLIHHVLSQNPSGDLALVTTLLVRGDNLDVGQSGNDLDAEDVLDDSDSGEEDDEEMESEQTTRSSESQKPRSSSRLSRKDLLTLPKLDRLYQDQMQQQKRDSILSNGPVSAPMKSTLLLGKTLVRAPWLSWGLRCLNNPQGVGAKCYIESLGHLLRATTSLKPHTKVGVLSPLSFNRPLMARLWAFATMESKVDEVALAVFCDLFAHYLVALSDVDFLRFHTNVDTTITSADNGLSQGVMAVDIIAHLRSVLHDLYWNKPVVVTEVSAMEYRGRLLLAGTKVWNSLHERWNRLVRNHSFCDESTWWFPYLSTRSAESGVVPVRERGTINNQRGSSSSNDMMHVDGEDEEDESDDEEDEDQPMSAAEAETDALADAFRDPKMARVLTCIPQALPFDRRVKLFNSLLKADKFKVMTAAASRRLMMASGGENDEIMFDGSVHERVTIRRAKLYNDSMQQLNELGSKLKHRVQVSFVNQHGAEEAGIDGGGVFKEFLDDLIKDGFAAKSALESQSGAPPLFTVTPLQTLAVNYDIADDPGMLVHYEFLGRVLGKAVYESILVEPQFCLPFLNQLLGKTNAMEDLKNYDEEYYKNLNKLKLLGDADVESLGLSFEMTVGGTSRPRTVELVRGGRSIPVKTKAHVFQYMHAVSNQLLNIQGARQTKAFLRGFRDLIPAAWVRLFSANELQKLISGDDSVRGIDVPSLKKAMSYLGGYHPSQPYIQDFWYIVENDLTPEQQRKFLRFMTSCSRQPLLGFGSLEPSPSIQQIRIADADLSKNSKLPTSQTCMNLLKLPNYKDRTLLKEKLIAAIESGAGFELT